MSRGTIAAHSPGHGSLPQRPCAGAGNAPAAFYFEFSESVTTKVIYVFHLQHKTISMEYMQHMYCMYSKMHTKDLLHQSYVFALFNVAPACFQRHFAKRK